MNKKQQREFALICASRAVDKVDIKELNEYLMLICFAVESDMLEEINKTEDDIKYYERLIEISEYTDRPINQ